MPCSRLEHLDDHDHSAPPGSYEWAAIFLLLFGGLRWGIGWIAGLILLWSSSLWTTRDKLIGTLVVPGGLGASVYFVLIANFGIGGCFSCTDGPNTAVRLLGLGIAVLLLLAPIATAIYLARRAR